MEIIRQSKTNRIEESLAHVDGKDKMSHIIKARPIKLINHKNESKIIDLKNIKTVKQEFTWFRIRNKDSKPIQSFSGDIAFLNEQNKIEAIVEVVKANHITEAKFNFYETLGIFWLELSVTEIKNNDIEFCSIFDYNHFKAYKTNLTIFKTEYEIGREISKYNLYIPKKSKKNKVKKSKKEQKDNIKKEIYIKKSKKAKDEKIKIRKNIHRLQKKIHDENPSWDLLKIDTEVYKFLNKNVPSLMMK